MFPTSARFFSSLLFVLLGTASLSLAQTEQRSTVPSQKVQPKPPSVLHQWEFGFGHMQWNERMLLRQGDLSSDGVANFAGFFLQAETHWTKERWMVGGGAFVGYGLASSGLYSGSLTYDDGVNRPWTAMGIRPFLTYRVNSFFSYGPSAMIRYRKIDWEPQDKTLSVEGRFALAIAPQLDLRFRLHRKVTLLQGIAWLNATPESQWMSSLHYVF